MTQSTDLTIAVLTEDEDLRLAVRDAAEDRRAAVALELAVPVTQVTEGHLKQIQLCQPNLIVVDIDADHETGCRLAQHLVDAHPGTPVAVAAAERSPDLLMAAMRAGVAEFLEKPADPKALDEAFGRLTRRLSKDTSVSREGRLYAFFSPKGGAGTTTVASNFAIQLHLLTGKRVLFVDLDLELGEVAIFLGLEPRYSLVDLVNNMHRLDDGLLQTYVTRHGSGIEVVAAPHAPRQADGLGRDAVRRALAFLRERYDYVVVDASNTLSHHAVNAFDMADDVLLVTQVDVPSLRNIQRCGELIKSLESGGSKVRLVVNRFDPKGEITIPDVEETLGMKVYWTVSNDYDAVVKSINLGEPLVTSVSSATAQEIEGLVGKITGIPVDRPGKKKGGLLGKMFGRESARSTPPPDDRTVRVDSTKPAYATGGDRS